MTILLNAVLFAASAPLAPASSGMGVDAVVTERMLSARWREGFLLLTRVPRLDTGLDWDLRVWIDPVVTARESVPR